MSVIASGGASASSQAPPLSNGKVQELESVTIRFAGDSGDGMQVVGSQFADIASMTGLAIYCPFARKTFFRN